MRRRDATLTDTRSRHAARLPGDSMMRVGHALEHARFAGAAFCALYVALSPGTAATYITFDPPHSRWTTPDSINNHNDVTGFFVDHHNRQHAFLRRANGAITEFDYPGGDTTYGLSINDSRTIVGTYVDASDNTHCFIRTANGVFTSFDPGSSGNAYSTAVINNAGDIAGNAPDSTGLHGYAWPANGTVTPYDVPGATSSTRGFGESQGGTIVGSYLDAGSIYRGYIRAPGGAIA